MRHQHDTMVPTKNLQNHHHHHHHHHYGSYSNFLTNTQLETLMPNGKAEEDEEEDEGEELLLPSRSAKLDLHDNGEGWLQLGIGAAASGATKPLFPRPAVPVARVPVNLPSFPAKGMCGLSCSSMKVVGAPPRPEAGVWLALQAAHNQRKEPFLPQIPKSYLRIKDGSMTVRVLMKYLANKLGMRNESEVEITCRGQHLPAFLMLKYVRDHIWYSREAIELLPSSPSPDHVMALHYSRCRTE